MPLKKKHIIKVKIGDLVEYERNNKIHTDKSIEVTKESIEKFEYTDYIQIDEDGILLAGHGRKKALLASGKSEDEEIDVMQLIGYTEKEKAEYRIVHNLSADKAEYHVENVEMETKQFQLTTVATHFNIDMSSTHADIGSGNDEIDPDDLLSEEDENLCICPKCKFEFTL